MEYTVEVQADNALLVTAMEYGQEASETVRPCVGINGQDCWKATPDAFTTMSLANAVERAKKCAAAKVSRSLRAAPEIEEYLAMRAEKE